MGDSRYVSHTKRPEWGVGVLVVQEGDKRTFLFEDGGWRTLKQEFCDRFLEPAPAPASAENAARLDRGRGAVEAAPRAIHLELEQEILRDRDDPGPYLVYADWLQGRDDPRGELITLQHELSRTPNSRKLKQAEAALFKAHGEYLVPGRLAALLRQRRRTGEIPSERSTASWYMGFLRRVRVASHAALGEREAASVVEQILRHPSAHFMQGISVGHFMDSNAVNYGPTVAAIAEAAPAHLREVELADVAPEQDALPYCNLGDISPLFGLPGLDRLIIRTNKVRAGGPLVHQSLRSLALFACTIPVRVVQNLQLPALEELTLSGLNQFIGSQSRSLFDPPRWPGLRRLALRHTTNTDMVVTTILKSSLLDQLVALDLRGGLLSEKGAAELLRNARRVGHLEQLSLTGYQLSADTAGRLAELAPQVELEQLSAETRLTRAQVLALVPDHPSYVNATKLARVDGWIRLGRDDSTVWGEIRGGDDYEVYADLSTTSITTGCTCPSPKYPCKHALGLLMIVSQGHKLRQQTLPGGLVERCEAADHDDYYDDVWE
jgi:uncharacterized protein (TIGR02996 family)